jgi:hypothetical protein
MQNYEGPFLLALIVEKKYFSLWRIKMKWGG